VARIDDFGLDTITLPGPFEAKLRATRDAGFGQIMLSARDLAQHPDGVDAAVRAVKASGLRVTGLQVLRDFEGLDGDLHGYKVDIAKAMLAMCASLDCRVLLACSSTSRHASDDRAHIASDLRKLAMLALPLRINVAYEALSWGRSISEVSAAWDAVQRADMPNLGLGIDSYHLLATETPLDALDTVDARKIVLVQLSDFLWQQVPTPEERLTTARTYRVFPGEGVHTAQVAALVTRLDRMGYRGDFSFEVFNDDYQQLPPQVVAERGYRAALWLGEDVLRRSTPLPNRMRLQRTP
jgi:sugar phosphate isomerase/epimerase